ncbi:MAG: S49 family peptidase, partial [Flavobacteriales bacterium]|nr:S49 family peptidase [Flavobacteriales bacterium]
MKNFWGSFLGAIAGTVVAGIVASVIVLVGLALIIGSLVSSGTSKSEIEISKNSVLRLKLDYDVNDKTSHDPFSNMDIMSMKSKAQLGLDEMLASIRYAKEDKNITGIYLQLSTLPSGMATLEEIRNALLSFKESGKFIVCYTEYMTQKAYYMATVADEIYLNPAGFMDFKGLSFQLIFFSKTLQKLGLDPEVI